MANRALLVSIAFLGVVVLVISRGATQFSLTGIEPDAGSSRELSSSTDAKRTVRQPLPLESKTPSRVSPSAPSSSNPGLAPPSRPLTIGGSAASIALLHGLSQAIAVEVRLHTTPVRDLRQQLANGEVDAFVIDRAPERLVESGGMATIWLGDFVTVAVGPSSSATLENPHGPFRVPRRILPAILASRYHEAIPWQDGAIHRTSVDAVLRDVRRDGDAIGLVPLAAAPPMSRVLPVKGVEPSLDSYRNGTYPFGRSVYLLHQHDPEQRVQRFLTFLRSTEGRRFLAQRLSRS